MDQVVGLTVMVKLKQPANAVVYGVVQDAVPNSHLALENGMAVMALEFVHRKSNR